MAPITIRISSNKRKMLMQLKSNERQTYNELLNELLSMLFDLVPSWDDEGKYTDEFRASLLRSLMDIRRGRVH